MIRLAISYRVRGFNKTLEYNEGDVDLLVAQLARDGLGVSTQSLILRLISTFEELALHEEQGFRFKAIEWVPDPSKEDA